MRLAISYISSLILYTCLVDVDVVVLGDFVPGCLSCLSDEEELV